MNKQKKIGIALLFTVGLLVMTTSIVFANSLFQALPGYGTQNFENDQDGAVWGPMHGRGRRWESDREFAPMKTAMVNALAEVTGLTVEDINNRLDEGERLFSIAQDAALSEAEFFELMREVRKDYLATLLEEGWLTEERYQRMLERIDGNWGEEGYGGCHFVDDPFSPRVDGGQRGRRARWQESGWIE
jgi:hypothetical protein